jgi:Tat protein secretion system quality control protein TatD with DNase activity
MAGGGEGRVRHVVKHRLPGSFEVAHVDSPLARIVEAMSPSHAGLHPTTADEFRFGLNCWRIWAAQFEAKPAEWRIGEIGLDYFPAGLRRPGCPAPGFAAQLDLAASARCRWSSTCEGEVEGRFCGA